MVVGGRPAANRNAVPNYHGHVVDEIGGPDNHPIFTAF